MHSIPMPMLVAIFVLALVIFGPLGFGPREPRPATVRVSVVYTGLQHVPQEQASELWHGARSRAARKCQRAAFVVSQTK